MHVPCQVFTIRDDALTIDAATPAATRKRCQALPSVPASAGHDAARHIIPRFSTLSAVPDHRATLIIARMLRQQQDVRSSGQQQGRHGQGAAAAGGLAGPGTPPNPCYVITLRGWRVSNFLQQFQPVAVVSSRLQRFPAVSSNPNRLQPIPTTRSRFQRSRQLAAVPSSHSL